MSAARPDVDAPPHDAAPGGLRHALDGVTVIDFTQMAAGPNCTMLLADMGARVVKVEPPGGEASRALGPAWLGTDSAIYHGFNRNKLGVSLDLKSAQGVAVAKRLIDEADVVVESMRPGVMARLGLGAEQLLATRPELVYCSISAYGQSGPCADWAGVDGVVQADAGLMSLVGLPGHEPCKVQAPIVDVMTGYIACLAVLARLLERHRDGRGGHLDVNLFNAALVLQQSTFTAYLADGERPVPSGSAAPYSAPNQAFETADGWIMVAAYMPERWTRLCRVLGRPELAADARFATSPLRVQHRAAMVEALTAAFRTRTTGEWLARLREADILCAPVATVDGVMRHPQLAANRMIAEMRHPTLGAVRAPGFPVDSAAANVERFRPAPACGQDTRVVLRSAGYGDGEIDALVARGAVHAGGAAPAVMAFHD